MEFKYLNVGCGIVDKPKKDVCYLDMKPFPGVNIVRDIEKGLPFANETFEKITAHHILEHITDLIFVMNEFHRTLKQDGKLDIIVPFRKNAHIDPTHIRFFIPESLNFFLVKDFNSVNVGIEGWFNLKKFEFLDSEKNPLALHWELVKK